MKTLIVTFLLSLAANANNCTNLEQIADTYKMDLRSELSQMIYPKDKVGQQEFKAKIGPKILYLKNLKHNVDLCYADYGIDDVYNCKMSSDLIKERHHGNLITTYTGAISLNYECMADLYLGHTITKNENTGRTIYMKTSGIYVLNTLDKCVGDYTSEEYSFRKILMSKDNIFIMDQYIIYRTDVKVLGKKYVTQSDFNVEYTDSEVIFHHGPASFAISKEDGSFSGANYLSQDELSEGRCQTVFDKKNNSIYPRTNIDEEAFGLKLEYVAY